MHESRYVENATFLCRLHRYTFPIVEGRSDIFAASLDAQAQGKKTRDSISLVVGTFNMIIKLSDKAIPAKFFIIYAFSYIFHYFIELKELLLFK